MRGKRVLVVEDDVALREMVAAVLDEEGATVVEAGSLGAAEAALSEHFDLMLVDHVLPDGFGASLCRRFAALPRAERPACMLFSALSDIRRIARDAGADAWVAKPFDLQEFVDIVRELVGRSR